MLEEVDTLHAEMYGKIADMHFIAFELELENYLLV